jgi:hypothetical protein
MPLSSVLKSVVFTMLTTRIFALRMSAILIAVCRVFLQSLDLKTQTVPKIYPRSLPITLFPVSVIDRSPHRLTLCSMSDWQCNISYILPSTSRSVKCTSCFSPKFILRPKCAVCPAYLILLDLITFAIFGGF